MTSLIGKISTNTDLVGSLSEGAELRATIASGARGASAYEIWLRLGNKGTEEDFINSLRASEVNYEALDNKPKIESVELVGDKSFEELGMEKIGIEDIEKLF